MKTLNFNHLYYFVVIAREGSVSKACKKLFVTQPTLSGQLRQLEDFFGRKLFDRKKKRLYLNKHGELVLTYATQIFKMRDEMVSAVRHAKQKPITKVGVGFLPSLSKSHAHEFISMFWRKDNVELHVREAEMKDLLADLKGGGLDVVLTDTMVPTGSPKLGSDHLFSRDIVAIAAPKWSVYRKGFPKSLDGKPFLSLTPHSRLHDEIELFFYSNHISPRIMGYMDDVALLRMAAESGRFFVILPKNAAKEAIAAQKVIVLGYLRSFSSDLWAITRKGGFTPEIVSKTIDRFKIRHEQ